VTPLAESGSRAQISERLRRLGRGFLITIVLTLVTAYAVVWYGMVSRQRLAIESIDWPTTSAEIVASEVREARALPAIDNSSADRVSSWQPTVEYRYEVEGQSYVGQRISIFTPVFPHREGALEQLEPFPVGAPVTVFFDRKKPSFSLLIPGPDRFNNTEFYALGGGFLVIFIVLLWGLRGMLRLRPFD